MFLFYLKFQNIVFKIHIMQIWMKFCFHKQITPHGLIDLIFISF